MRSPPSLTSDLPRRGRRLFWLATAGLICLFPLFFVGGPGWSDGPLITAAWNLGHPIFFGLLTLTARPWRWVSGWVLWAAATAVVTLLGLGVEFAQSLDNRYMSGRDMFRNLTGLWVVLAVKQWAGFPHPHPLRQWLIRAVAVGLLCIDLFAVTRIAIEQVQIRLWLPDLYNVEQAHPERYWRGNVTRISADECGPTTGTASASPSAPSKALAIALSTRRYSGASLDNLPPDWRGYGGLEMVIRNPQSRTIPLTLRINDRAHEDRGHNYYDRFNRIFPLTPGVNRIYQSLSEVAEAPDERTMNMDGIRRLMIFTSDLEEPGRICLVSIKLVEPY